MSKWLDQIPWFIRRIEEEAQREHVAEVLELKNGGWGYDEIIRLNVAVKSQWPDTINWVQVARDVGTRDRRSCMSKWKYLMDGPTKTTQAWDRNDDDQLWHLRVVDQLRWCQILKHFPGITINQMIGRFKTLTKQRGWVVPKRMLTTKKQRLQSLKSLAQVEIHKDSHYSKPLTIPGSEPVKILEPVMPLFEPMEPMKILEPVFDDLHGDLPFIFDEEPNVDQFRDLMEINMDTFDDWHPSYGEF
jgi:hypothetical protein